MNNTNNQGVDDRVQITALMQRYIDAGRSGSVATLRPIFHPLATICGHVGPDLFAGPIQMFYDWHTDNGPAADLMAGDMRIDVEGSAATCALKLAALDQLDLADTSITVAEIQRGIVRLPKGRRRTVKNTGRAGVLYKPHYYCCLRNQELQP